MSLLNIVLITFLIISKIGAMDELETGEDLAEETQHAVCKILTQEIQSSANATIRRQLKGVCTFRQIERRFKQLEARILYEFEIMKKILSPNAENVQAFTDYDYSQISLKNINTERADQLNNTLHFSKGSKMFTYYWKISEISQVMEKTNFILNSPEIEIEGNKFTIQLLPNYPQSNYLGFILNHNPKNYRFTILEQFDESKDIISQILNYNEIYKIPYAKLRERHYLHNNRIIAKLTIYFSS